MEPAEDSILVEREQSLSIVEMNEHFETFEPEVSISKPRLFSTPKKTMTKCPKLTEICAYPWDENEELVLKELSSQKNITRHLQEAIKTLEPREWLNSNAIDKTIQALIVSAHQDSCCLLVQLSFINQLIKIISRLHMIS